MFTTAEETPIQFGALMEDRITGMKGVVVEKAEHLVGCERIGLRPSESGNNRRPDVEFFYGDELTLAASEVLDIPDDPQTETDISLGDRVRDDVTGFEGVVTTITYNAFNTPRAGVTDVDDPSEDRQWFDVPRLDVIESGAVDDYDDLQDSDDMSSTGSPRTDVMYKSDSE